MDAVAAAARAANEEPVVYVAADAELRSARRVVVDQPVYAWVERALGDDDAAGPEETEEERRIRELEEMLAAGD